MSLSIAPIAREEVAAMDKLAEAAPDGIVDTHVHLWDPKGDGPALEWLEPIPALNQRYSVEEFTEHAGTQVGTMLFMETGASTEQAFDELEWVTTHCASKEPRLVAGVFRAPVELGDGVKEHLDTLTKSPFVKGIRRLIQGEADGFCSTPEFITGVKHVAAAGLPFDICVTASQLGDVIELVTACPEAQFVLDHFGKPDVKRSVMDPWREQIEKLAALPNVVLKLSGITTEADHESWRYEDLEPYFQHAVACFGDDRLIFGGDWPVAFQATTYPRFVEVVVRSLGAEVSVETLRKVFVTNALRVYSLPAPSAGK